MSWVEWFYTCSRWTEFVDKITRFFGNLRLERFLSHAETTQNGQSEFPMLFPQFSGREEETCKKRRNIIDYFVILVLPVALISSVSSLSSCMVLVWAVFVVDRVVVVSVVGYSCSCSFYFSYNILVVDLTRKNMVKVIDCVTGCFVLFLLMLSLCGVVLLFVL